MASIKELVLDDVQELGRDLLYSNRDRLRSMEHAAQLACRTIYEQIDSFALVRIFRLCTHNDLPPDIQNEIGRTTGYWMTLMGSYGDEETWRDRKDSVNRQAIDVSGEISPMFQYIFDQLGVTSGSGQAQGPKFAESGSITRYVFLPKVLGSEYITDQAEFVEPYGIKSALALSSPFNSGSFYVGMMFAKEDLTDDDAEKLVILNPFVSSLLAVYDGYGKIWT